MTTCIHTIINKRVIKKLFTRIIVIYTHSPHILPFIKFSYLQVGSEEKVLVVTILVQM